MSDRSSHQAKTEFAWVLGPVVAGEEDAGYGTVRIVLAQFFSRILVDLTPLIISTHLTNVSSLFRPQLGHSLIRDD